MKDTLDVADGRSRAMELKVVHLNTYQQEPPKTKQGKPKHREAH